MTDKKVTIKIENGKYGNVVPVGINGIITRIPCGVETAVEPEVLETLRTSGVDFEEIETKKGEKVEGPAPADTPPAMLPRSLDDSGGDQPGDVTSGGGSSSEAEGTQSIADRAAISDVRVAAERTVKKDAPAAELAGEGEGGAPTAPKPKAAPKKK